MHPSPSDRRAGFLLTLPEETALFVGPVLPEDADRLREGLTQMSPDSRYLRFFTGLRQFSEQQVRYFTQVDQNEHVAWGALDPSQPGWPGVAIARFARLPDRPGTAEWAIAIIDPWQQRGLGQRLLAILYLEAEAHGIDVLTALVLPENRFVLDWLGRLGATVLTQPDAYQIELPIRRQLLRHCGSASGEAFSRLVNELEPRVRAVREQITASRNHGSGAPHPR